MSAPIPDRQSKMEALRLAAEQEGPDANAEAIVKRAEAFYAFQVGVSR